MITSTDVSMVFSVLDAPQAEDAKTAFFHAYRRNARRFDDPVHWMDVDPGGRFLRGGVSQLASHTTTLVAAPDQDRVIASMLEMLRDDALKPGRILPLGDEDCFLWLLPTAQPTPDDAELTQLRALRVTFDLVGDILDTFNTEASLTPAEKRVICQLVMGGRLRDAADRDGVSFETKRSQIKSACQKLDCASQIDVMRLALGQLFHLHALCVTDALSTQVAEDFVADHCPAGSRFRLHKLADGRFLRVVECGPPDGAPMLLFHSMMFAPFLIGAAAQLRRYGVRLIMPVRPGFLEPPSSEPPFHPDFMDRFARDVADYIRRSQLAPVRVVSHGIAGLLALRFATLFPALAAQVNIVSVPINTEIARPHSLHRRFRESLARLATTPQVYRLLAQEFRRRYDTPKALRKAMRRLFRDSPSDVAAFEGDETRAPTYVAVQVSYQSSHVGVADDFYAFYKRMHIDAFDSVTVPVQIIHGSDDSANPLPVAEGLVNHARGDRLAVIAGAGQLCFASHAAEVWQKIATWNAARRS